ncbi:MAG TPA: hypothetical protein ENK05_11515 [Gammaproteobacteria bacterium]|nr:hypothetical protein [Gammaproteobacteria bacterium]
MKSLRLSLSIVEASEPLRKRAPVVDENGDALTDFMVLFPGLSKKPGASIEQTTREIHRILGYYSDSVVFAELNLELSLLWISARPVSGVSFEIAEALRQSIPDARLVSHV